ncbi:E3 ubiquitin-protein ligase SH3RF1-like [Pollicipes pollicipes]|uniref:E3 ubiquitin-protein ligase SH3RF1-like n=1 Tax=Pollicipes pollicipes TaxID=41117 RepID=UPI0018853E3E|nr:E3 ubiquitin-protein ligase SH3RF1-like [Pollicipes pollicipes]
MDSSLLDALECAICLNQLSDSNRVLPCQHTFCLHCLQDVVASRGQLHCPECRTPVTTPVDQLPQNIVLIRLLETLRTNPFTAAPPAPPPPAAADAAGRQAALASLREALAEFDPLSSKPAPAARAQPAVPCARALYSYAGQQDGDLAFKEGDVIQLRRRIDFDWFEGQLDGRVGVFPVNRVAVLTALANRIPQCRALSQFTFPDQDGKTYLRFSKGEIVTLIRPVDAAWAEGKLGHRLGLFPLTLVELNSPANAMLRAHGCLASSSKSTGVVPPLPPPLPARPSRGQSEPSKALRRLTRPAAPPSENQHRPLQRVRSWGAGMPATLAANTVIANRNTSRPERTQSELRRNYRAPTPLVIQRYRCTMDYPPSSDVELELRANDIVFVHKKRSDGWMKGTHEKTGKTGLFPATFVELC